MAPPRTPSEDVRRPPLSKTALLLGATAAAAAFFAWWMTRPRPAPPPGSGAPGYAANDACLECHDAEAKAWATSRHFQAMARATDATVRGDFSGVELEHAGVTSRFFRRDGRFFVHTDAADGRAADFEVQYTFGVDPLQQYLLALPGGRLQAFTIAWDTRRARWFHLLPDEQTPPGDVLHWTGRYQTWNTMCASCHSTNLEKRYDARSDTFRTTWTEINVSCQSCHGPGATHVAWAMAPVGDDPGLPVDFRAGGAVQEVDACAPCHARRAELAATPVPGRPLYDDYLPSLLREDLYWADGQQLGEVYEYGSFRQSRMYQAGVRCTDCHDPHTAGLRADGDALCVRCHQTAPDSARFPTLAAGSYDSPTHHFHDPASPGARCVACHMPTRDYMLVDPRRDHAIRIPRPDLTVKIGVPNACTACHAERSAEWAAEGIVRWYGPERRPGVQSGEIIAAGRAGRAGAEEGLVRLVSDASQPAIVRATAVDLLGRYGPASVPACVAATRDPDPAVRVAAVASLERVPAEQRMPLVEPLLRDRLRAVRIEAARVLSATPTTRFDPAARRAYEAAMAEFVAVQQASLDLPGAHLNLGVVYENEGRTADAEAEYRAALRLDPDFTPARLNLSRLLNAQRRNAETEQVLRDGLARVPAQGELAYSLGLLLAEEERLAEAAAALGRAADLMPTRARVRYNYGLALQRLGRLGEAEAALVTARHLDPTDPAIAYALAVLYAQQGNWPRALASADDLAALAPDDPQMRAFVADVRRRAGR